MNKDKLASLSRYVRIEIESFIIPITVDLLTHKVIDWKSEYGSKSIFEKVVDTGTYILLDENMQELYRIEGYVPNEFLPEKDGYGDYLTLCIAQDGTITNWYDEPNFQEFIEQGYSPLPITSEENIQKAINFFLLPLSKSIDDKLIRFVKNGFYDYGTSPQLSLMPNETHKCLELSQDEEANKQNPEYARYLREIKSMWLDFYTRCPLYSNQSLRYVNIWTDIELHEDHIFQNLIKEKFCKYLIAKAIRLTITGYSASKKSSASTSHSTNGMRKLCVTNTTVKEDSIIEESY